MVAAGSSGTESEGRLRAVSVNNSVTNRLPRNTVRTFINKCTLQIDTVRVHHSRPQEILGEKSDGRRGRRRKQLLDELKEMQGYCKLKDESLYHTRWRTRFGKA